jgi:hypothetical protein
MQEIRLKSWNEFRATVHDIRDKYGIFEYTEDYKHKNIVLFRGHSDATWELETTLERYEDKDVSLDLYLLKAHQSHHEIEALTGKNWNLKGFRELIEGIAEKQSDTFIDLGCHEYLIYLRHHGFPSPLLDWSSSPYVAAYFAFFNKSHAEDVAIHVYIESTRGTKTLSGNSPVIHTLGPYVTTDVRHFSQKAQYTITTQFDEGMKRQHFKPHSSVLDQNVRNQDLHIKIIIPASERLAAIKELDDYNINHYTLFGTEDALVQALAIKQFDLSGA